MKSTYIVPHGRNPHTRNPHSKATNPHRAITWVVSPYNAPQTIGEIHIPDYENVLKSANMALHEIILKVRHSGKALVE